MSDELQVGIVYGWFLLMCGVYLLWPHSEVLSVSAVPGILMFFYYIDFVIKEAYAMGIDIMETKLKE